MTNDKILKLLKDAESAIIGLMGEAGSVGGYAPSAPDELGQIQTAIVELQSKPRLFPMQDGPAIPWDVAEQIYEAYKYLYGSDYQSLERIAERCGFGWAEVSVIWDKAHRKGWRP